MAHTSKQFQPHMFILQKLKNPPNVFFTHLFFASAIIQIFSGLFLHRLYKLLRVNINWIRVPKPDVAKESQNQEGESKFK